MGVGHRFLSADKTRDPASLAFARSGFRLPTLLAMMLRADSPRLSLRIIAEGVGVEPTNGFLDRYGLANRWLTIRRNPPNFPKHRGV